MSTTHVERNLLRNLYFCSLTGALPQCELCDQIAVCLVA